MRQNYGWHAREGTGFGLESFEIDWDRREATCPEGKTSIHWRRRRGEPIFGIAFSPKDCGPCPSRDLCVRLRRSPGQGNPYRELTVPSRELHEALRIAREREETEEYTEEYARHQGIEKVRLGHALVATALNYVRAGEWFSGASRPAARRSPFEELVA